MTARRERDGGVDQRLQRAATAVLAALVLAGCSAPSPPASPEPEFSVAPTPTPRVAGVLQRVKLNGDSGTTTEATVAAPAFGSIWIPQIAEPHGWLLRIDGGTGRQRARVAIGAAPGSIAFTGDAVWVANTTGGGSGASGANTLMRVDPAANRVTATVRIAVGGPIAAGFGSVWVPGAGTGGFPLRRVDARTGRLLATYPFTGVPTVACGQLWVTQTLPRDRLPYPAVITRVDPSSGAKLGSTTVPEGSGPPSAVGNACLALTGPNSSSEEPTESWVATISRDGELARSPRIAAPTAIMAGRLWIRHQDGVVVPIDARGAPTGSPAALPPADVTTSNWSLVAVAARLWVVSAESVTEISLP